MERRMRLKLHVRCEAGEKPEITSKAYLSLYEPERMNKIIELAWKNFKFR